MFCEVKYGALKMAPMTKSSCERLVGTRRAFPVEIDSVLCWKCDGRGKVSMFVGWFGGHW